ncbi:MAG: ABC transporter permease [Acidobacteria bacterium]|nr:ABC transporter permease [Acidobacteriota bacterium]
MKRGRIAAFVLLAWVVASLCAPWLAPAPYERIDLANRFEAPSPAHLLGTDELGRDLLSRLLYGGRVSLSVAAACVAISLFAGGLLGAVAGYRGGTLDFIFGRIVDILMALPGLLLAIAIVAYVGRGLGALVFALCATAWVGYARVARSLSLSFGNRPFSEAARVAGATQWRVLQSHIIPNVAPLLLVQSAAGAAGVMLSEAGLSFLGLGIQPPYPSWGATLSAGCDVLLEAPHLAIAPGALLFIVVWSLQALGEAGSEQMDPRRRNALVRL